MTSCFEELFKAIDYQFNEEALLSRALTHRSVGEDNNERSEFLGDAILNFLIAEWLFQSLPNAKEGELSRVRSFLVCGDSLAQIAQSISLGEYLNLGPGELKTGGHKRNSILSDALEAMIAAVYLDSNIDMCRKVVFKLMDSQLDPAQLLQKAKDSKSQLQEYLQGKHLPLPTYHIERIDGKEHAQTFYVSCSVESLNQTASGCGTSRRRAEQNAAKNLLKQIAHG